MIAIAILTYSLLAALAIATVCVAAKTGIEIVRDIRNGDF